MTDDDRVTCTTCRHLRDASCLNAVRAQMSSTHSQVRLSVVVINLPQRCHGYAPSAPTRSQAMRDDGHTRRPTAKSLPSDE